MTSKQRNNSPKRPTRRARAAAKPRKNAGVVWIDKDGKPRIAAATLANGTVALPTKDLEPPKKP